jgi:hypothetical protein
MREARRMAKNQDGTARVHNGKIAATRVRVPAIAVNGARRRETGFIRSSHSLSTALAKQLRALAYEQQTSESSIIECALWLFFKNGSDANVLRLMSRANIEPRRRRR